MSNTNRPNGSQLRIRSIGLENSNLAEILLHRIRTMLPDAMYAYMAIGNMPTANRVWRIIRLAGETDLRVKEAQASDHDGHDSHRGKGIQIVGQALGIAAFGKDLFGEDQFGEIWEELRREHAFTLRVYATHTGEARRADSARAAAAGS